MINKAKYNCLEELKKPGPPIVIVAVTQEIEAIINACTENGIKVSGLCDNETRKVNKVIKGMNVIHTVNLTKKFTIPVRVPVGASIDLKFCKLSIFFVCA